MKTLCALVLILAAGSPAAAQAPLRMPQDAANLVVQVLAFSGDADDSPENGAGIVFAATDRIIIATAAHVVRASVVSQRVRVVFQFARKDTVAARVDLLDSELDLAVLSLPRSAVRVTDVVHFGFDRLGDPSALESGAPLTPVGCPLGVCWDPPVTPVGLISGRYLMVRFESYFISPGSSGGALFNRNWEVVGLVTEQSQIDGRAIDIREVRRRLVGWRYRVQLHEKSVPRAGYQTRLSLTGLTASEGSFRQAGRWPGGRAALLFRGQSRVGWHVAAVRLAPQDMALSGGLLGADLRLQAGAFALVPFVEAGFARFEGRFDAGGYTVQSASGPQYVPVWQQATDDVVGFGGGISVEVTFLPHVGLELLAAHWSFRKPAPLQSLPAVFAGAGLRFGF
jgi:trypsin-like peptidase